MPRDLTGLLPCFSMEIMSTDAKFWNDIAERYAAKPVERPEAFERKIALTRARMRPDHVVLDVGCGTGSLALRLAPSGQHIHGLDVSQEMVRIARDKALAQGRENVTFHLGPFDESFTALEEGSLDGICAYSLLHLLPDRPAALARIHRLLKPGGFFVSSTVCLKESWIPYGLLIWVMRKVGKAPWVGTISKKTLAEEIEAAGFTALEAPEVGAQSTVAFFMATKPLEGSA